MEAKPAEAPTRGGRGRVLHTETDPSWLNIDPRMPTEAPDGSGFLWTTEREGAWQLEHRDAGGRRVRVVVGPGAGWRRLVRVDWTARTVWFEGASEPSQNHVWRVGLDGGDPVRQTDGPGWHGAVVGSGGDVRVLLVAPPDRPVRAEVWRADGTRAGELPSVAGP